MFQLCESSRRRIFYGAFEEHGEELMSQLLPRAEHDGDRDQVFHPVHQEPANHLRALRTLPVQFTTKSNFFIIFKFKTVLP